MSTQVGLNSDVFRPYVDLLVLANSRIVSGVAFISQASDAEFLRVYDMVSGQKRVSRA